MVNIRGSKKGIITMINLLGLVVVLFMYFVFLPILNDMSDTCVAALEAAPNDYTPYYVTVIRIIPLAIGAAIILSGIALAIPKREGVPY